MSADGFTYQGIKDLAKELRRPEGTLIALTTTNDPFHASTPGRIRRAEWFAELWNRFGFGVGTHIRRVHYRVVSQETPISMVDGKPYLNTLDCWQQVKEACRDARLLGMVDHTGFVDRRNKETFQQLDEREKSAAGLHLANDHTVTSISMPDLPSLGLTRPIIPQRYHLEIIVEKTTADDIIEPLCEEYHINATSCAGQISLTRCFEIVQRARASGHPVRILYVSDFDPAGRSMPVACARKIEFLLRDGNLDLDIQLRQVVLTEEQTREYRLPRTPLKTTVETEAWKERYGEGATELDALEALHPGVLRQILVDEIERYYDTDLDDQIAATARDIGSNLDEVNCAAIESFGQEIVALEAAYAELGERTKVLCQGIEDELRAKAPDISDIEWPEPKEGDEDDNPLYDSTRSYVDQMDRYKAHQGKPTVRKARKGRNGTATGPQK